MRTPVFELHILPMFRLIDREHMIFAFDLFEYDQVVAHAEQIADRAAVDMPPVAGGGPWPDEWVQLFRRWMATGFKRLELGMGQYARTQSASAITITASGTFPAAGYKGWLQLDPETDDKKKVYVIYLEKPDQPVAGQPPTFNLRERYRSSDTRTVYIKDSAGLHQLL